MKGPTNSSARPNIRLLNVSATFESNPDTSNNTEFPYRASIEADGVSEYMSATVMFSQIQAISGNFATYCQTDEGVIYIYSKTDVGTITIPAVSCDLSVNYINVDNVPTEDSQAVITSGGVYDAIGGNRGTDTKPIKIINGVATAVANDLVSTSGNQTIAGQKTFTNFTKFNEFSLDNDVKTHAYYYSDSSGGRYCQRVDNSTSDRTALFEILSNNDASVKLRLQRRKVSDGSYVDDDYVVMRKEAFYKAGDSITLPAWSLIGAGWVDWNGHFSVPFRLDKLVWPGTSVKVSGNFQVESNGRSPSFTISNINLSTSGITWVLNIGETEASAVVSELAQYSVNHPLFLRLYQNGGTITFY